MTSGTKSEELCLARGCSTFTLSLAVLVSPRQPAEPPSSSAQAGDLTLYWRLVSVPSISMPSRRMSEEARLKKKKKSNERAAVHSLLMGFRELQLSDQDIVGAAEEDFTQYDTEQLIEAIDEMLREKSNHLPPSLLSEAQLTEESAPKRTSVLSEAPNLGPSYYAIDGGNREAAPVSEPAACSAGHAMAEKRQEEDLDPSDDDVLQLDIGEDAMDL